MTLTTKQQAFVDAYLANGFNATAAARQAGYQGDAVTLASVGYENIRKPQIAALIEERIKALAMGADEALARLSGHARGDMSDFVSIKGGLPFVDLNKAADAGKLHLLKKFKVTKDGVEIELYDAQSALVHILREQHLKSGEATERVDLDDTKARDARDKLERALARIAERK